MKNEWYIMNESENYKVGDKVITRDGFLGSVAMVYKRYVDVQMPDGSIRVTIPAHGEIKLA
jgi:preprotein translocase subunit YajC